MVGRQLAVREALRTRLDKNQQQRPAAALPTRDQPRVARSGGSSILSPQHGGQASISAAFSERADHWLWRNYVSWPFGR